MSGQVKHGYGRPVAKRAQHVASVSNVCVHESHRPARAKPAQILRRSDPVEIVENRDIVPVIQQTRGEIRAQEAAASGDQVVNDAAPALSRSRYQAIV